MANAKSPRQYALQATDKRTNGRTDEQTNKQTDKRCRVKSTLFWRGLNKELIRPFSLLRTEWHGSDASMGRVRLGWVGSGAKNV